MAKISFSSSPTPYLSQISSLLHRFQSLPAVKPITATPPTTVSSATQDHRPPLPFSLSKARPVQGRSKQNSVLAPRLHLSHEIRASMPPERLRDALRGLCCGHGWSYGALWRPERGDPRLLVMEECYYEEQMRAVIDNMRSQVHTVGEGYDRIVWHPILTLGAVAVSGKHQWIYSDTCMDPNATRSGDNLDMFQGNTEWQHQFIAGIKTIAIISLPLFGVVHFGSSQKISESLEFLDRVKYLFKQLESMMAHFLTDSKKAMDIPDLHAAFASIIPSGGAYSNHRKINFLHENACEVNLSDVQSSTGHMQPTSFFPVGSQCATRSHSGGMNPRVLAMPVISSAPGASISNSISRNSSFHLTNQCQVAGAISQAFLSPNTDARFNSSFPDESLANCLDVNNWDKEISTLPVLEQRLFSGLTGISSMAPRKSHISIPRVNTFGHFGGCSSETWCPYGSQGDLSTNKSFSKEPSFASDLPDNFFTFPHDLTPEHNILVHSKDDPVSDLIHSRSHPLEQSSNVLTAPVNDVSSCVVGGDSIGCSRTTELPSRLVESSNASAVNSLNASTMLLSNNDPFDGMELGISPRILGRDNWDDIILPAGSDNCSTLSTSVPDCIDLGSINGLDREFFSESTLEQLLDAVVAGNVNLSSNYSSVAAVASSAADPDSENQPSKITKAGDPQVYRNLVASGGHPSLIQTSAISLPECSSEKIMQGSPKEALSKSHVSSWIDDSWSMNTESAIINQSKKPDEAAKVARKRARPGESTRPRPKDRQQIQDRVKELREIVPNGAKCSIDSLLDRTIKHMLFLQSVTKYADKLKQADEPKMIGDESGVVVKDNLSGGGSGATWAYEVTGQTMVCPILVEDVNPPGQTLIEMLCEDRGFFLEIADIIRGFGLTILKGVMETRDCKIWARFLVEANRDVTRMDIFLSLVQLLQQTSRIRSSDQPTKTIEKGVPAFTNYQQSAEMIPISLADRMQ